MEDGICSNVTTFFYWSSICTSHSDYKQPINTDAWCNCNESTSWCETNMCIKIWIWKNIKSGIIKCVSCGFCVSRNNHFVFFLVYFFNHPEEQWEVLLQLSNKERARVKGRSVFKAKLCPGGVSSWGFGIEFFEVFWIFTYQVVWTHTSVSTEQQLHSTAGNLPASLSRVKKPQEKWYFFRMVISLMGAQQPLLQNLRQNRNICQIAEGLIQLQTSI